MRNFATMTHAVKQAENVVAQQVENRLRLLAKAADAEVLSRFFQTGPGQYAEGDIFLGVRVPDTRSIVKEFKGKVTINDVEQLTLSPYHEIRLAGFLLLLEIYLKAKRDKDSNVQENVVEYYLSILHRGNNWDLVDLVAYKLLGDYLVSHPQKTEVLFRLSNMRGFLWHQRVAIVSTMALVRVHRYDYTFKIAQQYIEHSHPLIHKATGWLLREIGKHGGMCQLRNFLDSHAVRMPRTMLRYAIEKMSDEERTHYMRLS